MFTLYEATPVSIRAVRDFPTFDDAESYARQTLRAVHFERDSDFEGCADFISFAGTVYAIEPVERRRA